MHNTSNESFLFVYYSFWNIPEYFKFRSQGPTTTFHNNFNRNNVWAFFTELIWFVDWSTTLDQNFLSTALEMIW